MNREIKFRGMDHTGRWVYGDLVRGRDGRGGAAWFVAYLENGEYFQINVNPATIGQFTGLYDADGGDVYEGDVLTPGYIPEDWNVLYIVQFCNGAFVDDGGGYLISGLISDEFCRVVGTIHDPKPE